MTKAASDIKVLPKQMTFLRSEAREVLYSGAFGAGKSRAICIKLVMRASIPGAREGLCRKHLVTLKATTLKTLLEDDGDLPAILPMGTYTHNKSDKTIKIDGGGEIQYFGLDDSDKIGSYNLTGCGVDEAVEVAESDWTQLRGRIRVKVSGLPNQLYGACNPGTPSHFLAERFGLANGAKIKNNCDAVQTRSTDNFFLPQDYVDDLNSFVGIAKARYVDGKWAGSDGLVYGDRWDRSVFVQHREGPFTKIIVGQDEGYTNPAVMLVICIDGDDRIHVAEEWYHSKKLEAEVVQAAESMHRRHGVDAFVVDPSAAKLRAAMRAAGLEVAEANNDVFGGIQAVQQRIVVGGDGRPRFTVDPSCENTIREFETYEWAKDKDKPIKAFDHAMDAIRYAVMEIDKTGPLAMACGSFDDTDERPDIWDS